MVEEKHLLSNVELGGREKKLAGGTAKVGVCVLVFYFLRFSIVLKRYFLLAKETDGEMTELPRRQMRRKGVVGVWVFPSR